MNGKNDIPRLETGVHNLDVLLGGGVPLGSVTVIAGPPGAGKTILTQQICFHNASSARKALYFTTLSEPTAKTLRYLRPFDFFDPAKLDVVQFVDLGILLRSSGLSETSTLLMDQVKATKPSIVVIDSFKVFDELARSPDELRKFGYELAVQLMAWETTAFLLGEYPIHEIETNPLFSIVDGLILISRREQSGEQQRFLQITKMRGTEHRLDEHPFVINPHGIELFAARATIQRDSRAPAEPRCQTGISKLDELLGEGIPRGSTLLLSGAAGTGKTILGLEFLYRGAQAGEKGILFSFEETEERLRAAARGLGWDFDREIERGMIQIVFIPQPQIQVEAHVLMIEERIEALQAKRVVVDSVSVFLHKVTDLQIDREKIFQLASIVQNAQAVGLLVTDIPYGSNQISRFGVEETVVDGVVLLSSTPEGLSRQRYLEVYKLRNTAHLKGRHNISIGRDGITVFPRYNPEEEREGAPPPAIDLSQRLTSGVPGLDEILGGGLLPRSTTLVSGSAGIGKSTLALQFITAGARREEPGIYVALEEGPAQVLSSAEALGLPLSEAVEAGLVEIVYLSREHVRANEFLTILTDRIRAKQARRLVLDSASHILTRLSEEDVRHLLYALVGRFKALGVTSVLTLEASTLFSNESVTERGFSPITDNLIMLRYERSSEGLRSTLTVVKTRGSSHGWGTYTFSIGAGGLRIESEVER